MTKREVERQLRGVHSYRDRSRRRRRAMAPAKHRMQAILGLLFGVGLVALLAAVQLATQGPASATTGHMISWGQSHKSAVATAHHTAKRESFFPKRKRPYNPRYDPRSRRAEKRRRAMFWR